ncbi:MAG: choice-of-anchor D domain-containing protein [Bacteriovoracaceae bacterium]
MRSLLLILVLFIIASCQPKVAEVSSPYGKLIISNSVDFGFISTNLTQIKLIEIQNAGGGIISDLTFAIEDESIFKFTGDEYPGLTGSCSSVLAPGAKCVLELQMQNSTSGTWKDNLSYSYYDTIDRVSGITELTGRTGTVANLKSTSSSYIISPDEPNTVKTISITISNIGELPATNTNPVIGNNPKFSFQSNNCPSVIPGGSSCTMVVRFLSSDLGTFYDTLITSYNNGESNRNLNVSISATAASIEANLVIVPYFDDELPQYLNGQTHAKKFRFKNAGYLPGEITSISFDNATESVLTQSCTTTTLQVESVCELSVNFTPSIPGQFSRNIQIQYNSGKSLRSLTIPYSILVNRAAELNFYSGVTINSYDFGPTGIGETKKLSMLVKNEGDAILIGDSNFTGLSGSFSLGTSTCQDPVYIFPASTCILEVLYTPSLEQIESATMTLSYSNGFSTVAKNFVVSGSGVATGLLSKTTPTGSSFNFGEHRFGIPSQIEIFTFQNTGTAPLDIVSIGFNTTHFGYEGGSFPGTSGNCPTTLGIGDTCSIALRATAAMSGGISMPLSIVYHNSQRQIETTYLTLNATIVEPALLKVVNPIHEEEIPINELATIPYEETLGFYSRSRTNSLSFILRNIGDKPATISSLTLNYISGGANPFSSINTSACLPTIAANDECVITLNFNSATVGEFKLSLNSNYNNGYETTALPEHRLGFTADNLAIIETNLSTISLSTVTGTPVLQNYTISNTGTGPAPSITFDRGAFPGSQFSFSHNCPLPLPAGSNCTGTVNFNPNINSSWGGDLLVVYDNGGAIHNPPLPADLNFHLKEVPIELTAQSFTPANITVNGGSTSHDFGNREINSSTSRSFTLRNTGGLAATITSCTGASAPIIVTCPTTIAGNSSTTLTFNFNPLNANIGQSYDQNYIVSYNTGVEVKQVIFNIKGNAIAPKSTHRGWRDVFANGSKTQGGSASVSFKWLAMTIPNSIAVSKYRIYRKVGSNSFNLSTDVHLAEVTNLANLSYTDNTVSDGTIYYYYVVPMIFTSHLSEPVVTAYSTLRVVTPPKDMSLVHRITANQVMCENILGLTVSALNWNRCSYDGPGSDGGFFDIVHDLVVDVFETNILNTNLPNQLPRVNMGQQAAWDMCRSKTLIFGGSSSTLQKRLLTRKEFLIASRWNPSFNNSTIESYENGITSSSNCNNNGTLEFSGNNSACVSHFGLMDMFGNAWEWVADRMVNGMTASAIGRLVDIDDYENINFSTIETQQAVSGFKCLAPALGMPVPKNIFNACDTGLIDISATPVDNYRNDYFFSPAGGAQALVVGGSHSPDNLANAGFYTSAWVSPSFTAGARCAFEISY